LVEVDYASFVDQVDGAFGQNLEVCPFIGLPDGPETHGSEVPDHGEPIRGGQVPVQTAKLQASMQDVAEVY
jgi:hypothetical protein